MENVCDREFERETKRENVYVLERESTVFTKRGGGARLIWDWLSILFLIIFL